MFSLCLPEESSSMVLSRQLGKPQRRWSNYCWSLGILSRLEPPQGSKKLWALMWRSPLVTVIYTTPFVPCLKTVPSLNCVHSKERTKSHILYFSLLPSKTCRLVHWRKSYEHLVSECQKWTWDVDRGSEWIWKIREKICHFIDKQDKFRL